MSKKIVSRAKKVGVDQTTVIVAIIVILLVMRINGFDPISTVQNAFNSILPKWGGGGDGGDDGDSGDDEGDDSTPSTPWITIELSIASTPHNPRTPVTGAVTSNRPNARIIVEEKLRGDTDPYGITGWPHTWVETFSATTDSSGSASAPFTCIVPGAWEIRATLVDSGVRSPVEDLEVRGVMVDVPQEVVNAGEEITIRIFSSYYNQQGFKVWESTDGWATMDLLMTLTSDNGGYTYMSLYTGTTGTHEFRGQAPDGAWSYNTESCVVN